MGNYKRRPLPVRTKRLEKPNGPLGGTTVGGIEDVPDRARLMRTMASQLANRVESIKLLDGRYNLEKRP
jgi:hypothetical protein